MTRKLSSGQVALIEQLRTDGWSLAALCREFKVSRNTVKSAIDPAFKAKYLAGTRERDRRRRQEESRHKSWVVAGARPTDAEFRAAQRLIPPDTRDLTARICGDPIFQRSALFAKLQAAGVGA